MSLKFRLIILTIAVLALTFGLGTLLGVRGARRLAEAQLESRLARSAERLAGSSAPLNDSVLREYGALLDAQVMVLDSDSRLLARSGADWPWEDIRAALLKAQPQGGAAPLTTDAGRYFYRLARRELPATGEVLTVVLLADEGVVREPTRAILYRYLAILCVTAVLLSIGMYVVGLTLVRRIARLNRRIDQTLPEGPAGERRGDEVNRLADSFDGLLERLNRSRERLAAQQRLATTGKLASSIAHEVRNPLQAIRLTAEIVREKSPPEARDGCDVIVAEMDRLSLLTDELLVLAGKDTRRPRPLDLCRELHETLRLLKFQLRQRDLRAELSLPDLPAVRMDPNRCRQLLLNLLLNAAEASPRGAAISVTARADADRVVLTVADSGAGFPPQVLQGEGEELFSTKVSGAGLGLSICRQILRQAGGELKLRNEEGGARAEVALPAAEGSEAEAQRDRE